MSKEVFRIDYPPTQAGKKQWNKLYGTNAYWAGKHHAVRTQDARFWHEITRISMSKAHVRKTPFDKPVVITFLWNDRLDLSNHSIMAKMIEDALKGRIIHDDTRRWVKGIEHYWHDESCIKVIVREVEE